MELVYGEHYRRSDGVVGPPPQQLPATTLRPDYNTLYPTPTLLPTPEHRLIGLTFGCPARLRFIALPVALPCRWMTPLLFTGTLPLPSCYFALRLRTRHNVSRTGTTVAVTFVPVLLYFSIIPTFTFHAGCARFHRVLAGVVVYSHFVPFYLPTLHPVIHGTTIPFRLHC